MDGKLIPALEPFRHPMHAAQADPANANMHPRQSILDIADSLREHGQDQFIIVNEQTRKIVHGHGRFMAALHLGWQNAAMLFVAEDGLKALRRALSHHASERGAVIDSERLRSLLQQVEHAERPIAGFTERQLRDIGAGARNHQAHASEEAFHERETEQITLYFDDATYAETLGHLTALQERWELDGHGAVVYALLRGRYGA